MKRIVMIVSLAVVSFVFLFNSPPARAEVMVASMAPNLCLDANQTSNIVALWGCHGGANQNFFTTAYGKQTFNGRCLDQSGPNAGAGLVMAACDANKPSQRWSLVSKAGDANALGSLRNESGWCANIANGNATQGAQVIVWTCPAKSATGRRNDVWGQGTFKPIASAGVSPANIAKMSQVGSIVASGAGNIVASGAGNIVASGAGNIVASGAGNVIAISSGALMGP